VTDSLCGGQGLADFVALYRGKTVSEAELVAVSAEPRLVSQFFTELLGKLEPKQEAEGGEHTRPVLEVVSED
jgi:hypothetical protein